MNEGEDKNVTITFNDDCNDNCNNRTTTSSAIMKEIKALGPNIHPPVPNPAPLGLFAFGFTTALLQMKHTRLTGSNKDDMAGVEHIVWGFALFYGGLLQLIAGICEIKRNNIFGYTAFLSFGAFWVSLGTSNILVNFYRVISGDLDNIFFNPKAIQTMFILMGMFTFVLWICTFKLNMTLSVLIFSLMMTFFLLAGGVVSTTIDYIAGWFGLFTAAVAFWLASAELINDIHGGGNVIIPLGQFPSNDFQFTHGFHVPGRIHGVTHHGVLKESMYGPDNLDHPTLSERNVTRVKFERMSSSRIALAGDSDLDREI